MRGRIKNVIMGIIVIMFLLHSFNGLVIGKSTTMENKREWEMFCQKLYKEKTKNLFRMGIDKDDFLTEMNKAYQGLKNLLNKHKPIGKECVIISFGLGLAFPPGVIHTYNWIYIWLYITQFSFTVIIPVKEKWIDLENASICSGKQFGVAIMKYGLSSKGGILRPGFIINVGYCLGGADCFLLTPAIKFQ